MRTIRAFMWGGAIGALLGILLAPERGETTRARLQERFSEWQGMAQTQIGALRSRSSALVEQGRQAANGMGDRARRANTLPADTSRETASTTGTASYTS